MTAFIKNIDLHNLAQLEEHYASNKDHGSILGNTHTEKTRIALMHCNLLLIYIYVNAN